MTEDMTGDGSNGHDETSDVRRRTVLLGAAWSVPVIAMAVATPAAAASELPFVCPVLPSLDDWTRTAPNTGTIDPGIGQFIVRTGIHGREFYNQKEASGGTGSATVRASTTISLVAGHTYTLNWYGAANYGSLNQAVSVGSSINLVVGDTGAGVLWRGSTRPQANYETLPDNTSTTYSDYGLYAVSFTAAATGVVPIYFNWTLNNNPSGIAGDDIAVTRPQISCS